MYILRSIPSLHRKNMVHGPRGMGDQDNKKIYCYLIKEIVKRRQSVPKENKRIQYHTIHSKTKNTNTI